MIPKLLMKGEQPGHGGFAPHFPPDPSRFAPIIPQYHVNQFVPTNVVMQATSDIDSLLQVHRRKMLRRAANRRSAQQSRARKKALMGDLKTENLRLQRLTDILESQPELIFTIDKDGRITYISDRASTYMKSSMPEDSDDDPIHINQILTPESVETVLECISQVRMDGSFSSAGDHVVDGAGFVSTVKSVCYHDANGFQVAGYIRCSRLVRRAAMDDSLSIDANGSDCGAAPPPTKKSRTSASSAGAFSSSTSMALTALNIAAASLAGGSSSSGSGGPDSNVGCSSDSSSNQEDKRKRDSSSSSSSNAHRGQCQDAIDTQDEEFVCVIRPADASFPISGGSQLFSSLLSTASMVAHDLELRAARGNGTDDLHASEVCRGSPSGSSGSGSQSHNGSNGSCKPGSDSSKATSYETGSDNGEDDTDEHEPL